MKKADSVMRSFGDDGAAGVNQEVRDERVDRAASMKAHCGFGRRGNGNSYPSVSWT